MNLQLVRDPPSPLATTGRLFIDGARHSYTLEPPDGAEHGPIPEGRYPVMRYASPHLGHDVLLVDDVPGRSEIEIHEGNEVCQTHGCVMVGFVRSGVTLEESRKALADLLARVEFPAWLNVMSEGVNA